MTDLCPACKNSFVTPLPNSTEYRCEACGHHSEKYYEVKNSQDEGNRFWTAAKAKMRARDPVKVQMIEHLARLAAQRDMAERAKRAQNQIPPKNVPTMPEVVPLRVPERVPTITTATKKHSQRGRSESPIKEVRWKIIRQVHRQHPELKGKQFWKRAYAEGARAELSWLKKGCPTNLEHAYDVEKWQSQLDQDKTRALKAVKKTPPEVQ
jgi:hypothetical protein